MGLCGIERGVTEQHSALAKGRARDNMRVGIESGLAVTVKTVADLRALATWPDGLVLDIHVDLDPRLSVARVERS
jgi:hypothetical protein